MVGATVFALVVGSQVILGSTDIHVSPAIINETGDADENGSVDLIYPDIWAAYGGSPSLDDAQADFGGENVVNILDLVEPQPVTGMKVERAFSNLQFESATNLVQPTGEPERLYVTDQRGLIHVFANDQQVESASIFLDIRNLVNLGHPEEGLLGLAFDPNYGENHHFYVYYSAAQPLRSVLSRFSVSQDTPALANHDDEHIIMEVPQPFDNHNGGQIAFGPDGYLYVGVGDGGSWEDLLSHGQNPGTLLGSVLRIDVSSSSGDSNYQIPPDNPFVDDSDARGEIWAYGLRNPWRFSFDERTGRLWLADVGQERFEEVDLIRPGGNYGWNIMEGNHCFSPIDGCPQTGLESPVLQYDHSDGCAITGGYVYHGNELPSLEGAYIYGDYCSGKIWAFRYDGESVAEHMLLVDTDLLITSFGQDQNGNVYVLSRFGGIYRLVLSD